MNQPVRIVIVDDSPSARLALRTALTASREVVVVGEARDGTSALREVRRLRPDLVTMDVHLASDDGLEVTRTLMHAVATPVLVVTGKDPEDPRLLFRALESGALEVVGKPVAPTSPSYDRHCRNLIRLVRTLASVPVVTRRRPGSHTHAPGSILEPRTPRARRGAASGPAHGSLRPPSPPRGQLQERGLLLLGASTGGPPVVRDLLRALPPDFPLPIALAQHIFPGFAAGFCSWLATETGHPVRLLEQEQKGEAGVVYVAPPERHLVITTSALRPFAGDPVRFQRPAIDLLFESAARSRGPSSIAVLMTGMGRDGALGLRSLRDVGACTIAQEPGSCVVGSMPQAAIDNDAAEAVLTPTDFADYILAEIARR